MATGEGVTEGGSTVCDLAPSDQETMGTPRSAQLSAVELWKEKVQEWYPGLYTRTYTMPPLHFNRMVLRLQRVAGHPVYVRETPPSGPAQAAPPRGQEADTMEPTRVQKTDIQDDFAQQHMSFNMQALGKSHQPRPMFIILNLKFRDFLKHFSPHPPLPEGDFDIIIVGPSGIGIGEMKSIGFNLEDLEKSETELQKYLAKKIERAIKQLNTQQKAMRKMLRSFLVNLPPIRPILMLPYITRLQLDLAVNSDPDKKLQKKFCECLGAQCTVEATNLCLCSDDISDRSEPWHVPPDIVSKLEEWFTRRFEPGRCPVMSESTYLDILARMCGPATEITVPCPRPPRLAVRAMPEAVSLVGERTAPQIASSKTMACIVLTPQQIDLLNTAPKLVWLTGPPGTGKTITVVVQGLVWLYQGFDVHVLSTKRGSLAAAHMIHSQLTKALASDPSTSSSDKGSPRLHDYDIWRKEEDVDLAVKDLKTMAEASGGSLHAIVDECDMPDPESESRLLTRYTRFFTTLINSVPDTSLWVASVYKHGLPPGFEEFKMTESLRCPPTVLQEVTPAITDCYFKICGQYSVSESPGPCRGPPVMWLKHTRTGVHSAEWPVMCYQCGVNVAEKLLELGVGKAGSTESTDNPNRPPPLQFRDVMVLTRSSDLTDGTDFGSTSDNPPESASAPQTSSFKESDLQTSSYKDASQEPLSDNPAASGKDKNRRLSDNGSEPKTPPDNPQTCLDKDSSCNQACGFVQGLRSKKIRVSVLPWRAGASASSEEKKIVEDVAKAERDVVIVTAPDWTRGLERKIVVLLPGRHAGYLGKQQDSDDNWGFSDRILSVSRCTSQLIVVQCPGHPLQQKL